MHAQPTTTTEQTTWLELAYTPMGAKLAILQDRTANQIAHEYRAYDQTRDDRIETHRARECDGAYYIIAFRADLLKRARVTLRRQIIRLHIPATRGDHPITDCAALSPILTDAHLDSVRDTVKLVKELAKS
jgi:hypothetical protein